MLENCFSSDCASDDSELDSWATMIVAEDSFGQCPMGSRSLGTSAATKRAGTISCSLLVALSDLWGSLGQFGLEARPPLTLLVGRVPLLRQPEIFFSGPLRHAGEVLNPKLIKDLAGGAAVAERIVAQMTLKPLSLQRWGALFRSRPAREPPTLCRSGS